MTAAQTLPEISVIVCSYNHDKWLERCVRSLAHQEDIDPSSYEVIVVNDDFRERETVRELMGQDCPDRGPILGQSRSSTQQHADAESPRRVVVPPRSGHAVD